MVKGSCVCGQLTYEFTGEHDGFVACHCIPCRKTTGADRSLNLVVKRTAVAPAEGAPVRQVSRGADSGGQITYHQCGNCGSIMYAAPSNAPEIAFLKVGLLDDKDFVSGLGAPKMELYCKNLWAWEKTFEGAKTSPEQS